jgi:hypothetical protein
VCVETFEKASHRALRDAEDFSSFRVGHTVNPAQNRGFQLLPGETVDQTDDEVLGRYAAFSGARTGNARLATSRLRHSASTEHVQGQASTCSV